MKQTFIFFFFLICISTNAFSQTDFREEYQKAMAAYEEGEYNSFLKGLEKTNNIRPNHRVVLYNLAVAYVLNDMPEEALSTLEYRADFYAVSDFDEDEDFNTIKELKGYKDLLSYIENKNKPVLNSVLEFEFEDIGFHPEGMVLLPERNEWLISDVRCGLIKSYDMDGTENGKVIDLKEFGFWGAFGMKIDPLESNILWVTTAVMPEFCSYTEENAGKSGILKVDLIKKEVIRSYTIEGDHIFGDLTISENGDVYFTDSNEPTVYRIKRGESSIEAFLKDPAFFNLQGLALDNDRNLYVSDYITGLYKVGLSSKTVIPVKDENQLLRGTDGLYYANGNLILIQNGTRPIQISKIKLNNTGITENEVLEILDADASVLNEPTLGHVHKNKLYFVANSPWSFYINGEPKLDEWPKLQIRSLRLD